MTRLSPLRSPRLSGLVAAALLSTLPPLAASAQRRLKRTVAVTIVRPSGSPLDLPLVARLEESLATRRVSVLRVETLRARMAQLAAKRPSTAPRELAVARALELEARFTEAADRYAAAVVALVDDPRSLSEPRRIAEAELARGAAALQDGDEVTALQAMQAALGWVEDLQADPTFSPEARAILERARALGPTAPALPSREGLEAVTRASGARFVVYVTIGGPPSSRTLRTLVTERGRVLLDERRSVSRMAATGAAAAAAGRVSARISTRIRLPPEPAPFWQSPYFWGGVATALAIGTVTTLYITANPQEDVRLGELPR